MLAGILRTATGFFQIFVCIFPPVWADAFAKENTKPVWITILLLGCPLGIFLGFSMTTAFRIYTSYYWSFYLQAILLILCAFSFFYVDIKFLDIEMAHNHR